MKKDNGKVPVAVLSCFLIAFLVQGILKLCGVLVFEKALTWEIFKIIDSNLVLQIAYYSFLMFITVYCLSFSLTSKPYSSKWYHYIIIIIPVIAITTLRWLIVLDIRIEIVLDFVLYVFIPFVVNLTTSKKDKIFANNITDIIVMLSIQIGLYFCYLGLTYWSSMLTSIIITNTVTLPASTNFLIQFEKYIGMIMFMLSMNIFIKKIKESYMIRPLDIASDEAKEKELQEKSKKKGK